MSKSVYVMDMPNNCMECEFCLEIDEGIEACCVIVSEPNNEDSYREVEDYCQCKPDWCPLKPMPEKITVDELEAMDNPKGYDCGYLDGWNGCIDVMCGEEQEDEKRDN